MRINGKCINLTTLALAKAVFCFLLEPNIQEAAEHLKFEYWETFFLSTRHIDSCCRYMHGVAGCSFNGKYRHLDDYCNPEIFARILFSRIGLKDIFVTLKFATRA